MNYKSKFNHLIIKYYYKEFIILVFFAISVFFLEILSLGSVYPFLVAIIDEKVSLDFFGFSFKDLDFKLLAFGIFFIFFFKNVMQIFFYFLQGVVLKKILVKLTNKSIEKELYKNYIDYIKDNSAKSIRNVRETTMCFRGYVEAEVVYYSEILTVISVVLVLIFVDLKTTIIVAVLLLFFGLFYFSLVKNKSKKWGEDQNNLAFLLNEIILKIKNNFIDIKILNKEDYFKKLFNLNTIQYSEVLRKQQFISSISRNVFELLLILCLFVFLIITFNAKTGGFILAIPLLGIYSLAAFKMLPSLNRIINASVSKKTLSFSIPIIYEIYNKKNKKNFLKSNFYKFQNLKKNQLIKLDNISYSYNGEKNLLENINISINQGDFIGIKGESGTGKSTFCKIIMGLIKPTKGKIYLNKSKFKKSTNIFGYVPQKIFLFNDTILKNIILKEKLNKRDLSKLKKSIENSKIDEFISLMPKGLNTTIHENAKNFSGGQEQRIALARAFFNIPSIIVLDEATSALDPNIESKIINSLYLLRNEYTIILISHKQSSLVKCNKVYNLYNKKLKNI